MMEEHWCPNIANELLNCFSKWWDCYVFVLSMFSLVIEGLEGKLGKLDSATSHQVLHFLHFYSPWVVSWSYAEDFGKVSFTSSSTTNCGQKSVKISDSASQNARRLQYHCTIFQDTYQPAAHALPDNIT